MLIMELCTEGSLQKMLSEPEHVFGLRETLFISFFFQFGLYTLYTFTFVHPVHCVDNGTVYRGKSTEDVVRT